MRTRVSLWIATLFMTTQAAHPGPPELSLPLDCTLGQTCYIEDYVDSDPTAGQTDYTCGLKSRDRHRGTDIVLDSFDAMRRGVDVLAAAPGRVAATRDGMADTPVTNDTRNSVEGKECGNAVRIDHGDGWQTLYCHMRNGSVRVQQGDVVNAGDRLGQVGLSGLTNIPHVHLTVLRNGQVVDPFNPSPDATCGTASDTLWEQPPTYHKAGLFTAGFSTRVPDFSQIKSGTARAETARPDQPLVLYTHAFHARPGDVLHLSANGPEGEIFSKTVSLDDPKLQLYRAFGRKSPPGGWPEGAYRGIARLMRDDTLIAWRHADITVTSQ